LTTIDRSGSEGIELSASAEASGYVFYVADPQLMTQREV